ncbi:MAG: YbbR-like domain-containing protein [Flavobacteriaceae bacterium]|nr:YbbR-like domain-containing protein [Flavobacteriaceae bacterium]
MHKAKKQPKISKSFVIAIGIAVFFWLLTKLSKEYQTIVSFSVDYVNVPFDKSVQKAPVKAIDVQLKATGFKLFSLQLRKKKIQLDASRLIRKSSTEYYFLLNNQKIDIQHQISNNYAINGIVQDTVYVSLDQLKSKKVPVKGNFDLSFKSGYQLTKSISIQPDSVLISGPASEINKIQELELEKLALSEVSESFTQQLLFKKTSNLVKYTVKEVKIIGEVDRFTEGVLDVPFTIINLPEKTQVNTFPKAVKIVYQVGISNFNKVNVNSFRVVCDYKTSLESKLNYLLPKVIQKPSFVTSVRIRPSKIEFLIQK